MTALRKLLVPGALGAALGLAALAAVPFPIAVRADVTPQAVLKTYADIAAAGYGDSLVAGRKLSESIEALVAKPGPETLSAARDAWRAARVPYMQTEAYRFGNKIVDDWEPRVNAWPLDEGLIDYVSGEYGSDNPENEAYAANVIANPSLKIAGKTIDASTITPALLSDELQEAGGVEANVATGYHAIEFLLWGQDLNGTGPGAGDRPATDFDTKNCTGGNCERRIAYLRTVTQLLLDDLAAMTKQWEDGGAARKAVVDVNPDNGLSMLFNGLGSLSYGELAGERMKLGLLVHDPEEEHDCFSDNTHYAHYYDALGIRNVYLGSYTRIDGSVVSGPSVSDLIKAKSAETDAKMRAALDATMQKMTVIVDRAKGGEAYDQLIGQGNTAGNAVVQDAINALIAQAKDLERAIAVLDLKPIRFQGSDSLDAPEKATP